jgi:hypothetical protein
MSVANLLSNNIYEKRATTSIRLNNGNTTLTANDVLGGWIQSGITASFILPTLASVLPLIEQPIYVGLTYEFTVSAGNASAGNNVSITPAAGWTINQIQLSTVFSPGARTYKWVFTDVTPGAEVVVLLAT